MTQSTTATTHVAFTTINPTSGQTETLAEVAIPNGTGAIGLTVNGADIGDLRVQNDSIGRPSLILGQFDRRHGDWVGHAVITRRGVWVDTTADGLYQVVRDGRPLEGLLFDAAHDAEVAKAAVDVTLN